MLQEFATQLDIYFRSIQENIITFLQIVGAVWLLNIVNWCTGGKLNYLGVIPRRKFGLIGIFTGTFFHKDFNHLFFNSIPLLALGIFMLSFGWQNFVLASCGMMLIYGILLWLFARPGIHIGASSLISGYFSYLLISAYLHPSMASYLIAGITIYYFGSILLGIFPTTEKISWEGHLFGFIAGLICYYAKWFLPQLTFM